MGLKGHTPLHYLPVLLLYGDKIKRFIYYFLKEGPLLPIICPAKPRLLYLAFIASLLSTLLVLAFLVIG